MHQLRGVAVLPHTLHAYSNNSMLMPINSYTRMELTILNNHVAHNFNGIQSRPSLQIIADGTCCQAQHR